MPHGTKTKKLVAVNSIRDWQNDSLYIYDDDANTFYQEYSSIFTCGICNNLKSETVDIIFGINYYAPSFVDSITTKLHKEKPLDYITLLEWLTKAKEYNGFYILGL